MWRVCSYNLVVIVPCSPDYVMPADTPRHVKCIMYNLVVISLHPYIVVFAFWISEYMAIAVESVEMGGGGGT